MGIDAGLPVIFVVTLLITPIAGIAIFIDYYFSKKRDDDEGNTEE